MNRVPLTRVVGSAAAKAKRSFAEVLTTPTRKMSMQVMRPAPFSDVKPKLIFGDKARGEALMRGDFRHAGQQLNVGLQGDPWTVACPSQRFAAWLHSFHWVEDIGATKQPSAEVRARFLVDGWIGVYGGFNEFAWNLSILTPRLYHWLTHWSPLLSIDSGGDAGAARRGSVLKQMKYLRKNYAKTEPGLPRFLAALTIAMGGARLLEALMVLDDILDARGVARTKAMGRAIDRLQPILPFFLHTDGGLACTSRRLPLSCPLKRAV